MICRICPRDCGAERTETAGGGVCGQPLLPVAARAMLHQWEEPCLVGEKGAGTVFFSGCPLRCVFCQNSSISGGGVGKPVTVQRLREIFRELVDRGAACLDLVTPTHFTPAILEALGDEPWPVPVVWNCGGYEKSETLRLLEGKVQVYLPDLKYALPGPGKAYSAAEDYFTWAAPAILEMFRQTGPYQMEDGLLKRGVLDPAPDAAGGTGEHEAVHRLCGGDVPPRPGAVLPDEPVYPSAGGGGKAPPPCDPGGIPGGGGVYGKLRHHRRIHPGADFCPGGIHAGVRPARDLKG